MTGTRFGLKALTLAILLSAAWSLTGAAARADGPAAQASSTGNQPQLQQRYPRYMIHRQDALLITFPLSPELNQTVVVQPDGFINLQDIEGLHVEGLTVPELIAAVKQAYAGTLHNPIINVDLEDFQKPLFTVTGQVGKPGQYELREQITVAEAIAVAGGLTPNAKTQVFLFHKTAGDWYQVQKLNLKDVLDGKKIGEDPSIKPGDMVFVPEKFIVNFRKYVPYSVNAGTFIDPATF